MNDLIQKKCPTCGAILTIKNQGGLDNTTVTCPVCHQTYPFTKMVDVATKKSSAGGYQPDAATQVGGYNSNTTIGHFLQQPNNRIYRLIMGRNVIGRECASSNATIQINTGTGLKMSRQHLTVDVKRDPLGNVVHECYLCKPQCNDTFINGAKLHFGDRVILQHGNQLRLPDATFIFVIEDDEATQKI
ncbi:MAG: FHA domain-containing protein [Prevotella sp.]|nr:FHA domain-containing protein [Bacteroides sp.]MCM1366427.1 FHA domain-containing protein [Prevotella sp.]